MRAYRPADGARPAEPRPPRRPEHALLALQRTAGNRAVGGWVAQRSHGDPQEATSPPGGQVLFEGTRADGTTVIRSRVGRSPGRLGTEDLLPSSVEVDVPGWERAHSQGNITGAESGWGIRYAPKEVNQQLQRLGIERAIRDLFAQTAPDVDVIMTTETRAHPGSLRLAEIAYRIDLKKLSGATLRVYEAAIEVQNTTSSPRCTVTVDPSGWNLLESGGWLKAAPGKP